MLCLIKNKNIFGRFCRDVYTIEYQKRGLLQMHLLIFHNLADQFLESSYINKIIYAKLPTMETNSTGELTKIVTSIMFYGLYGEINHNSPCISNAQNSPPRCTKHYPRSFFEEISI